MDYSYNVNNSKKCDCCGYPMIWIRWFDHTTDVEETFPFCERCEITGPSIVIGAVCNPYDHDPLFDVESELYQLMKDVQNGTGK